MNTNTRIFIGSLQGGQMMNEIELKDFYHLNKMVSKVGIVQEEIETTECLDEIIHKVPSKGFYFRAQW